MSTTDRYVWRNATGGSWGTASNWTDVTSGADPATVPPTSTNPVTIDGGKGSSPLVVLGPGKAASLGVIDDVALGGSVTVSGALSLGTYTPPSTASGTGTFVEARFAVVAATTVTAKSVGIVAGSAIFSGKAATLASLGAVVVGTPGRTSTTAGETPNSSGILSFAAGGILKASADVTVASGTLQLYDTGTVGAITGNLVVGTEASSSGGSSTRDANGTLNVLTGAKLTVSGAVTLAGSSSTISASAAALTIAKTLTASDGRTSLSATQGGAIRLGGLVVETSASSSASSNGYSGYYGGYYSGNGPAFSLRVDTTSSIEIGTAGGAAKGALTIDAGKAATIGGATRISGNVVDDGVITESNAKLTIAGELSGSGTVQLGDNATLALNGTDTGSTTIVFTGKQAALEIGTTGSSYYSGYGGYGGGYGPPAGTPYAVHSTITGFAAGDSVVIDHTAVTKATYASTGTNTGTLTLFQGTTAVETLSLTGANYTGRTFFISPTSNGGSAVTLLPPSGPASAISTNADAYTWIGSGGGSWGTASNWKDTTSGANPATKAAGALTPVTISGGTGEAPLVVTGPGKAISLALTNNVALGGAFAIGGALTLGTYTPPSTASGVGSYVTAELGVGAGSTVSAKSVAIVAGTATFSGKSATLSSTGAVTLGTPGQYGGTAGDKPGSRGSLSFAAGAVFKAYTDVSVGGRLRFSDAGTVGTIAGDLGLGISGSTVGAVTTDDLFGSLWVDSGAKLNVTGAAAFAENGGIYVSGSAASLTVGGTLTASVGSLGAGTGAAVRLGGLVVNRSAFATQPSYSGYYGGYYGGNYRRGPMFSLRVDTLSSIEIGTAGGAAKGALTIDAGKIATVDGDTRISGNVVDNGVITESNAKLSIYGNLSGSGKVQIGDDATLALNGTASGSTTVAFTGKQAALEIGTFGSYYGGYGGHGGYGGGYGPSGGTAYAVHSTITGFAAGDSVVIDHTAVTKATYASTGTNTGSLTLFQGSTVVETLSLTGADYTGRTFFISPTSNGGSAVTLLPPSGPTSAISTSTDAYTWVGSGGGSWGTASNWKDTTSGANPATKAAGALTPVTISGGTGAAPLVVTGPGKAISLGLTNNVALGGAFAIGGALTLGSYTPPSTASGVGSFVTADLGVGAGSTVSAKSVAIVAGTATFSGQSATLSSTGAITLGTPGQNSSTAGQRPNAAGTLALAAGAVLKAYANVAVAYGTARFSGDGTVGTIAGDVTLGTAGSASGGITTNGAPGDLTVRDGAKVTVTGGISLTGGSSGILASGSSASLTIGKVLTAAANVTNLSATDGGTVRLAGLVVNPPSTPTSSARPFALQVFSLNVYPDSSVEIGTVGGAAKGALTIDAGKTFSSSGGTRISGNVVDNGTITETGAQLTISGTLSGTGTIQIGDSATVCLDGAAASSTTIAFLGKQAALEIGYGEQIDSKITGFAAGDSIVLDQVTVSKATYTSTGTNVGKLTLFQGSTAVETLNLLGADYTGRSFFVSPTTGRGSAVTLLPQTGGSAPPAAPAPSATPMFASAASPHSAANASAPPAVSTSGRVADAFVFQPSLGQDHMSGPSAADARHGTPPPSLFSSLVDALHHPAPVDGWASSGGPPMPHAAFDQLVAAHYEHGA